MKYKVLLAGNSKKLINSFFMQMDSAFECVTSSVIFDDLKNHVKYFEPDIFIFCMRAETKDDIISVTNLHDILSKNDIPFAVIGDAVSLEFVTKVSARTPDLTLRLPIATSDLEENITRYIRNHQANVALAENSPLSNALAANTSNAFDSLAQIDAALDAIDKVPTPEEMAAAQRQPETPGRHRILVIDDATIIHKAIKGHLESEFDVAAAISGRVALRYLKSKEVSLILLDYEMPELNGPAVLEEIRKDPNLANIPVVFLTGINDVEKIKNALALKPQGYLLKPVDRKALIDKIHELIK